MIRFTVYGKAEPAGSKRAFIVAGKARITDANAKAKPWKQEVAACAAAAMDGAQPMTGPVQLVVTFYRQRPKSHFKRIPTELTKKGQRTPYPTTKPDATKLLRCLEDACTGIVWRDDAQIVTQLVRKAWGPAQTVVEVTEA